MDEKQLRNLLRPQKNLTARRSWRCPEEALLAAYAEQKLTERDRPHVEAHLADCDFCLGQVAFLLSPPETAPAAVPAGLLLRARQLAETRAAVPGRPAWRWGAVAAATAGLMVIAAISLREPRAPVTPPGPSVTPPVSTSSLPAAPAAPTPATSRTIRKEQRKAVELQLIFPREGSVLSRSEVEFRWKSVRGSQFYEIRLVTAEGDVVWEGRVETTQARLPDDIELAPGREYFVSVRAYLPEGKTLKSPTVGFRARHPG
jgi:hypothetical protein